ncbi:hypothetical protein LRP88_06372 [Fusarium phalaenopsidis]
MIASYLVRESAMITAKNQSMFIQASDITVDLSKDVYASYSVVDGVRYIKSLRNIDTNQDGEYHLVLDAKKKNYVDKIRICEDHLGIRFGVKLRRITDAYDDEAKYVNPHIRWPSPEYPSNKADLMLYNYVMEDFPIIRNVRMSYFDCNAPDVTGYTMVCQGHWVSTIHAHGKGDDIEFYKEVDVCFSDQVVVYMPVDQGEYVTEIQRRWMGRLSGDFFELAFKTNRARHAVFGSDKEGVYGLILDTIMKPSQKGSRIYFNKIGPENEPSVRYIACDKAFEEPIRNLDFSPGPRTLDPPVFPSQNPWFASRCNLGGVKEVTLCRDVSLSHRPVIGMLMEYTDGHRECLGQFRFDRALKTIQADQSGGLHISLQMMEDLVMEDEDSTYVADVYGFPLGDPSICPENESWIEALWSGTLEWKFKPADCAVTHIPVVQ